VWTGGLDEPSSRPRRRPIVARVHTRPFRRLIAVTAMVATSVVPTAAGAGTTTSAQRPAAQRPAAQRPAAQRPAAQRPAPPRALRAQLDGTTLTVRFRASAGTVEIALRGAGTRTLRLSVRRASGRHGRLRTRVRGTRTPPRTLKVAARRCARPHHRRARCSRWSRAVTPRRGGAGAGTTAPPAGPSTPPSGTPAPASASTTGPTIGTCPLMPADYALNQDISQLPVDPRSDAYIATIGTAGMVHPDFGAADLGAGPGGFGIPVLVVGADQPLVPVTFTAYGDESDPGPYPAPLDAPVEGGPDADGDRHVLVVREGECKLYEMGNAYPRGDHWEASGGAVFDLRTGAPRPTGWTSADAAGLPILPGLARYDEVAAGAIRHALRFTVARTQRAYVAPASHWASSVTDPDVPPMGLRLRLKGGYDISRIAGQARVVAEALKRYGMIVADNGSNWYIGGAPDPRWDDEDLDQLKRIPGSAFEAVQTGPVVRP
jgi:hypothetical protein